MSNVAPASLLALALGIVSPATAGAQEQAFPSRTIVLVVGLAPGSVQDAAARTISRRAAELLRGQIIIDNKPGAGTMNASLSVAKAPPDGYTLLQNGVALSVNPSLYSHVPYNAAADFAPVAYLVNAPQILVVNPKLGVRTLAELLARYKEASNLDYASPGAGTMPHLCAELFRIRSGIKMTHVPYRGGAPALMDVIAGHVPLTFVTPVARSQIESGAVIALAAASAVRLESLPNVPTFAEAGLAMPELDAGAWFGVLAPKGTPASTVSLLNEKFNAALRDPEVRNELRGLGLVPKPMSPEEFGAFMRDDMERWPAIVKSAGIKGSQAGAAR